MLRRKEKRKEKKRKGKEKKNVLGTYCTGGWVGSGIGSGVKEKSWREQNPGRPAHNPLLCRQGYAST
jgi:hypothetical protein